MRVTGLRRHTNEGRSRHREDPVLYPVRMPTVKGACELLWQLSGELERNVPRWEHSLLVWRATSHDATGCTLLVNLCARQGTDGLKVRSVAWIRRPKPRSTAPIRERVATASRELRERGYELATDPLPEQPLLAVREVPMRELRAEHLFLSELAGKSVSPLPRRVLTTLAFSEAIAAASGWNLHESEWTIDRKIRVCGKEADALARVRVAPPGGIGSEISVQVWLPWSRRGRPPGWFGVARTKLGRQLRAGGLTVRRIPSEPSLVFASRPLPRGSRAVMRMARHVGALRLGDGSELRRTLRSTSRRVQDNR